MTYPHIQASIGQFIHAERDTSWPSATALVFACVVAIAALYSETIIAAVTVWRGSEAHQFSFLVLPVSLYFIWVRREDLVRLKPRPDFRFALLTLPAGMLWLAANAAQVAVLAQFVVVGMLQIAVLTLIGPRGFRILLFPLLFLWLLVPFGEIFLPFLVKATTWVSVAALNLFGLVTQADGNLFTSGAGEYIILKDCAALDFLIGNTVISLVFANLMYLGLARRAVYVIATLLAAFLANAFRIVSVVLITEYSGGAIDLAIDHALYGWLVFFVAVVVEMKIGLCFRDSGTQPGRAAGADRILIEQEADRPASLMACLLILATGIAVPPLYASNERQTHVGVPVLSLQIPPWLEPVRETPGIPGWAPRYAGSHAQLHAQTTTGGQRVEWFIAYYWSQGPGIEMIRWGNDVFDSDSWHYLERRPRTLNFGGGKFDVIETRLHDNDGGRRRVWHWYWIDGRLVADPLQAKLLEAGTHFLGGHGHAAVVAISAVESDDGTNAADTLQGMLKYTPDIERLLLNVLLSEE